MTKTKSMIIILLACFVILLLAGIPLFFYLQKPRTLIVPDKYENIISAMNQARPGDTVFVKAGFYQEPNEIVFKDGVIMVGEDANKVKIQTEDKTLLYVIRVKDCNNGLIQGVTVESGTAPEEQSEHYGILIDTSSIVITDCCVRNMAGGILITNKSNLTLRNSFIESNSIYGIYVREEETTAVFENNAFTKSGGVGLWFNAGGAGFVQRNLFEDNKGDSISASEGAGTVTVRENACITNEGNGIFFSKTEKGLIEGNYVAGNVGTGIYIVDARDTIVSNNRCMFNSYGICFSKGATGTVKNNICQENRECGIYAVGAETDIEVLKNNCKQNFKDGMYFYKFTKGKVEANICNQNLDDGIVFFKCSECKVGGNICEDNESSGIYICNTDKITVRNNWSRDNHQHGIYLATVSDAIVEGNIASSNKGSGIVIDQGSSAVVAKNSFYDNHGYGIWVEDKGTVTKLIDNECTNNNPAGILFNQGASGTAKNNLCKNNSWSGIAVRDSDTTPALISNTCNKNGLWGIITWAGADPNIVANNITSDNGRSGIKLHHQVDFGLYKIPFP